MPCRGNGTAVQTVGARRSDGHRGPLLADRLANADTVLSLGDVTGGEPSGGIDPPAGSGRERYRGHHRAWYVASPGETRALGSGHRPGMGTEYIRKRPVRVRVGPSLINSCVIETICEAEVEPWIVWCRYLLRIIYRPGHRL